MSVVVLISFVLGLNAFFFVWGMGGVVKDNEFRTKNKLK